MAEKKTPATLEKTLSMLEKTVSNMESGDLPLDKALAEFEKGIGYVNECQKMLKDAEQRIEILTKEAKGKASD